MNKITYTNTWAKFEGPNIFQAREVLQYRKKGYAFSPKYKAGLWDGYIRLMRQNGTFAAGLVPWLVERLTREGIQVQVIDARPEPLPLDTRFLTTASEVVEFRPYQLEAIQQALAGERGIIHHPTAAGKTEVLGELARRIARPGLILVHRKELLWQTTKRLRTLWVPPHAGEELVGMIGDGIWKPGPLTVATFQSIYARLKEQDTAVRKWLQTQIGQVHVDEAHHLPAKTYERVMSQLWQARWRYGYSATPFKEGDDEASFVVASWLGPTLHRVGTGELAEQGYLVPADVFMIRVPSRSFDYSSWPMAVQYGMVEHPDRNDMICKLARNLVSRGLTPVVVLVERLQHGHDLAHSLGTEFVAGEAPTEVRQRAWSLLRQRRLDVLVTSKIADEGLDIPPLACLIMAGGGKAPHLTIQRVGRGLRTAEGKEQLFVFDFYDTGKYLEAHAKQRHRTYLEHAGCTVNVINWEEALDGSCSNT